MQGLVSHRRQVQACSVHVYPVHARAAGRSNSSTGKSSGVCTGSMTTQVAGPRLKLEGQPRGLEHIPQHTLQQVWVGHERHLV